MRYRLFSLFVYYKFKRLALIREHWDQPKPVHSIQDFLHYLQNEGESTVIETAVRQGPATFGCRENSDFFALVAQKRCRVATVVKEGAGLVERHKLELVGTDIVKPVAVPAAPR